MVLPLTYRRPSYVPSSRGSVNGTDKQKSINESISSANSCMSNGIPEALSFDRIINGGVCPPLTIRDFMNYLKYIELSAENLQFYLWHRDYTKRFAALPENEQVLSKEWTIEQAEAEAHAAQSNASKKKLSPTVATVFKGTDFDPTAKHYDSEKSNPFYTPPASSEGQRKNSEVSSLSSKADSGWQSSKAAHSRKAGEVFEEAGLKWQPFTVQPYREEISRIIMIYIAEGAPRQLNLSARERAALLHALEVTTHPSAFRDVVATVEWSLRCQSHPNFIRWTICNGNRPRVIFARGLGVTTILLSLVAIVLLTLSNAGRGWRVIPFVGFFIGISTLIAAWKGMCIVLHGMHHRHLRPWELFASDDEVEEVEIDGTRESLESNSFEDEPWVAKYEKRNIIRKVFDREVWIQEPALRQVQDTIFVQALIGAFVVSAIIVGIFCAVPHGRFF
ncbi:hypothetical protein M501DRAFT_932495 [Patellaria atrata CBS 101060]|uniref:RGS domain-containing protein n=1 Tax=Patellaria atrata CBS 101060 TaxID=1346257 RepID=A0A9P4VQI4_9PEZI|nr:hypothetical protein M501DRAFT_932495 [Patellaria atrata CBS 101060]